MRTSRVLSLAFAAFVVSAVASCAGGDGGSPTGSNPSTSSGSDTHPNGTQLVLVSGGGGFPSRTRIRDVPTASRAKPRTPALEADKSDGPCRAP